MNTVNYRRLVALLCMITAISITNRWLVTPLGLESFGRIWYLFVSYQDLGFVKRALEGTILKATGLSLAFENPYRFAFLYHSCKLILLIGLICRLLVKNQIENRALIYAIFFLPHLFCIMDMKQEAWMQLLPSSHLPYFCSISATSFLSSHFALA